MRANSPPTFNSFFKNLFIYLFIFCLRCRACGTLVPQPGIEPVPPALQAWSLNHWTAREVPQHSVLILEAC